MAEPLAQDRPVISPTGECRDRLWPPADGSFERQPRRRQPVQGSGRNPENVRTLTTIIWSTVDRHGLLLILPAGYGALRIVCAAQPTGIMCRLRRVLCSFWECVMRSPVRL